MKCIVYKFYARCKSYQYYFYICIMETITKGQVKQIAIELDKTFELKNHKIYYNIINKKTRRCSIEGGSDGSKVSGAFRSKIQFMYLQLINKSHNQVFDWQTVGVNESNAAFSYVNKIQNGVVNLLCGFKIEDWQNQKL